MDSVQVSDPTRRRRHRPAVAALPEGQMKTMEPKASPAPVNILLVDDRVENLIALEAVLQPLGQNLLRAHSGEEALRRLLHEDVAVILLDVQMPGLDGFETAAHIKQRERTRQIPIIFLTALSSEPHH